MENLMELRNIDTKALTLNKNVDLEMYQNNMDFKTIVERVVKSGIDYGLKAIDPNHNITHLLGEISKVFKGNEFKKIVDSSIKGSVKQGIEMGDHKVNDLQDINQFKEISLKGGLNFLLSAGIDIVTNKFLAGNILKPQIQKVLNGIKDFLLSNSFVVNIEKGIKKLFDKTKDFKKMCEKWFENYEKFDIKSMNEIAQKLDKGKNNIGNDRECVEQNNIIQNMTQLINHKKDKLSNIQLQICHEM